MEINFEALVQALKKEQIVDDNPKVYIVWWTNGALFREMEERCIKIISLSKDIAQNYVNKWNKNYKKQCDEFAAKNNFTEDDCEAEFTEELWIEQYNLQYQ